MRLLRIKRINMKAREQEEHIKVAVFEEYSGKMCMLEYNQRFDYAPIVTEKRDISDERKRMDLEWDMISTPIIENPTLSRVLYNTIEIGEEIGPELYQVAAELLESAACERD